MATACTDRQTVTPTEGNIVPERSSQERRFTLDGSAGLENHLARLCREVLAEVQQIIPPGKLEALVLGGGYGRGEGGVLKTEAGDRPYNDLEFYVFLRGNRLWNERRFSRPLRELGRQLSPAAGLHVEFKADSLARLRRSPVTMFSYDLVAGHRALAGNRFIFRGCEHHLDAGKIPLAEATRLMMNRCSGLLFAREKLIHKPFTDDDADFVGRNIAKAQLAFGDAVLTVFDQYHWSCRERHKRLQEFSPPEILSWLEEARHHHSAGVEFKLHPRRDPASRDELASQLAEVVAFALPIWLWLEGRRLDCRFGSAHDYARSIVNKCPGTGTWRNILLNARIFGPAFFLRANGWRHPREKILNALALLLWVANTIKPNLRRQLRNPGISPDTDDGKRIMVYQTLWLRLN